jgi:hypothetical protein
VDTLMSVAGLGLVLGLASIWLACWHHKRTVALLRDIRTGLKGGN